MIRQDGMRDSRKDVEPCLILGYSTEEVTHYRLNCEAVGELLPFDQNRQWQRDSKMSGDQTQQEHLDPVEDHEAWGAELRRRSDELRARGYSQVDIRVYTSRFAQGEFPFPKASNAPYREQTSISYELSWEDERMRGTMSNHPSGKNPWKDKPYREDEAKGEDERREQAKEKEAERDEEDREREREEQEHER